jgi:hypothetical protein
MVKPFAYLNETIIALEADNADLLEALKKIVKDGCGAINYRGSIVETFCTRTAREAIAKARNAAPGGR